MQRRLSKLVKRAQVEADIGADLENAGWRIVLGNRERAGYRTAEEGRKAGNALVVDLRHRRIAIVRSYLNAVGRNHGLILNFTKPAGHQAGPRFTKP